MEGKYTMYYDCEVEDEIHEECGVFGIYSKQPSDLSDPARTTFYGLYALQHRGQQSAGIAVSNGINIALHKNEGLVSEVIRQEHIEQLRGHVAIGHVQYSPLGDSGVMNAQPAVFHYLQGAMALSYNGSMCNLRGLREQLARNGSIFQTDSDTEIIANLLARYAEDSMEETLQKCMRDMEGAYALLIMTKDQLIGVRDPLGVKPLCIGRLKDDFVLASESAALDTIGATLVRDVEPGEIVIINGKGMNTIQAIKQKKKAHCIFEYVYLARPDSSIDSINVTYARRAIGRELAKEWPVEADVVISVPDSGTEAALGYAEAANMPFQQGLMKNRYVGRTFIQPTQQMRELGVQLKLNPIKQIVQGKRLIVVDDSIVRGTTSRQIVQMLRTAGAQEVHMMIASPPTKYPCYYGIDTTNPNELIANSMEVEAICEYIGADSLHYISIEGIFAALGEHGSIFCAACFDGKYPIPIEACSGDIS